MDLDKIRNMNDEELSKLLKQLSTRGTKNCAKCGKPVAFVVKIENQDTFQTRKLCGLCKECYEDMLEHLGLYDIDWDI